MSRSPFRRNVLFKQMRVALIAKSFLLPSAAVHRPSPAPSFAVVHRQRHPSPLSIADAILHRRLLSTLSFVLIHHRRHPSLLCIVAINRFHVYIIGIFLHLVHLDLSVSSYLSRIRLVGTFVHHRRKDPLFPHNHCRL
ncbi:hypothetical protein AXF42_Ash016598 [Apostasia shenzhenica]|uniref:Uncharacterized protein n=1 Tax=Apostasia shenzhenica TaxID=1088818 RepID=A0A2I0A1J6_9ASPA|nr:hypothetical protein AXF42_Ash016598 [Apostasia shenzhenica]